MFTTTGGVAVLLLTTLGPLSITSLKAYHDQPLLLNTWWESTDHVNGTPSLVLVVGRHKNTFVESCMFLQFLTHWVLIKFLPVILLIWECLVVREHVFIHRYNNSFSVHALKANA